MSEKELEAAQAIERFLLAVRGLAELQPHLVKLGSIKQATKEAEGRLEATRKAEAAAAEDCAETETRLKGLRAQAEELDKRFKETIQKLEELDYGIRQREERLTELESAIAAKHETLQGVVKRLAEIRSEL